jgi:hypothetical protein
MQYEVGKTFFHSKYFQEELVQLTTDSVSIMVHVKKEIEKQLNM